MLFFTGYKLLLDDWRGYIIAGFSLVWIVNIYMSLFGFIRLDIRVEKLEANRNEEALSKQKGKTDQNTVDKVNNIINHDYFT